jgi:hypothetical protein
MVAVGEAHAYAYETMVQHGLVAEGWTLQWKHTMGRTAGETNYRSKVITLSEIAVTRWEWPLVTELVLHEIAHAMVGPGFGHGPKWAGQVRKLDGTALQHCPSFTNPSDHVKASFLETQNIGFMALVIVAALIAVPPVGVVLLLIGGIAAVIGLARGAGGGAKTLSLTEQRKIEWHILNP